MSSQTFPSKPLGYIRQWLVAGPHETPYQGPSGEEDMLRRDALDATIVTPPPIAEIGRSGPFDLPWNFHYPGENFFVELSSFYPCLTLVDAYAFTEVIATEDGEIPALFWVAGAADLWVNGVHLTRFNATRYMYPDAQAVTLPLKKGENTLCVRIQCLGVRDTRILFGLQITKQETELLVQLPGGEPVREAVVAAANWIDGVRTEGRHSLVSTLPAPGGTEVLVTGKPALRWPEGESSFKLGGVRPFQLSVSVAAAGQIVTRNFEIPANRTTPVRPAAEIDFQREHLEHIAAMDEDAPLRGFQGIPPLTARRLLKQTHPGDAAGFAMAIASIDQREDCADFGLAMLLRLHLLGYATPEESAEIKRAALGFRYWSDEPGTDAMCFTSENHSLLFHGCQRIAGALYPGDVFGNSGMTGQQHATLGLERCRKWLDHVEPRGFDEFLSSVYMPITVLALLNLVDFAGDEEVSERATGLIDRIYTDLATHAFQGVTVGPQGRVYRDVLYPEFSGTQSLLAFASRDAVSAVYQNPAIARLGAWTVFVATSPNYNPPKELTELMRNPVSQRSRQADVEIVLHKTSDYLLTSLSIPAPVQTDKHGPVGLQPGAGGYQQHVWQATLGPGCHVFVNHPGCSFDESKSRPGYWYGNGILPGVSQKEGMLQAFYSIPDGTKPYLGRTAEEWLWPVWRSPVPFDLHPIPFTHAHWPADAFDQQEVHEHWAFGRKNSGYVALWCSVPLVPHNDVLSGRELRAYAYECTWVAICGSEKENGPFEKFIEECLQREVGNGGHPGANGTRAIDAE